MAECKKNDDNKSSENPFDFTFDEDTDNEPVGTQPIELPLNEQNLEGLSQEMFEELSCNDVWGWLHPTPNSKLKTLALHNETYSFGRHFRCDFVFKEEEFQDETLFLAISKYQFKVEKKTVSKDVEAVFLYDLSMNGTFVNKEKVGKGERVILSNNDEIALVFPLNRVFVFVDNSFTINWMTPPMKEKFHLKVLLGNGAYGEVRMARDKIKNKDVAIKKIKKRDGKECVVNNEIEILRKLKHNFIVAMEDVFESPNHVYIVLEYVSGGTLSTRVRECGKLTNDEAKLIFYQLVLALDFLHHQGVAHRDLKPENVLLAHYEECDIVKLSDFGLSKLSSSLVRTDLKTVCGTPYYTAPEILQTGYLGNYTHQVDIWSLGVTLFYCLSGTHPFHSDRSVMSVYEQIVRGSYSMMGAEWRGVSSQSTNVIRKMLVVNPAQRITLPEILKHPWLQDEVMKNKLKRVLRVVKSASEGNENLCTEYSRPSKRARHDTSTSTLRKS